MPVAGDVAAVVAGILTGAIAGVARLQAEANRRFVAGTRVGVGARSPREAQGMDDGRTVTGAEISCRPRLIEWKVATGRRASADGAAARVGEAEATGDEGGSAGLC